MRGMLERSDSRRKLPYVVFIFLSSRLVSINGPSIACNIVSVDIHPLGQCSHVGIERLENKFCVFLQRLEKEISRDRLWLVVHRSKRATTSSRNSSSAKGASGG